MSKTDADELRKALEGLGCSVSSENLPLPESPQEFIDLWNETSQMHWGDYTAEGRVRLGPECVFAALWVSYIHDDSGDNDGELAVAVFPSGDATVWAVMNGFVDPDSGESFGDPSALHEYVSARLGDEVGTVDVVLGFG